MEKKKQRPDSISYLASCSFSESEFAMILDYISLRIII